MAAEKDQPLIPPEATLWQQYSPHFELPLASATSIFLHGLVIGILAIGGLAALFAANAEATRPPRMDVVMIEGGGTGFEGLGGEPGLPGAPNAGGKRTELAGPEHPEQPDLPATPRSPAETQPELGVPLIEDGSPPISGGTVIELQRILEQAEKEVNKEMKLSTPPRPTTGSSAKRAGPVGTGNPKGTGGLGGSGGGAGLGNKIGPGTGQGGFGGRKATDQEIKASRWRFELAGDPKEHAHKLAAAGLVVAVPDPRGGFFIITDLNRRPVEMKKDSLAAYKDAVKWYSGRPESMPEMRRELQLPFTPQYIVLLLPKAREQQVANEEARYAREKGRDVNTVRATWFDFRMKNGTYDPTVLRQE